MLPPEPYERLRSLMEQHRCSIKTVAKLLHRTPATVRVWRSVSGANIPLALLDRLERKLKCASTRYAEAPHVRPEFVSYGGTRRAKILCPFCGEEHWHGFVPGPRVPHCTGSVDERHPDAQLGYIIEERLEVPRGR